MLGGTKCRFQYNWLPAVSSVASNILIAGFSHRRIYRQLDNCSTPHYMLQQLSSCYRTRSLTPQLHSYIVPLYKQNFTDNCSKQCTRAHQAHSLFSNNRTSLRYENLHYIPFVVDVAMPTTLLIQQVCQCYHRCSCLCFFVSRLGGAGNV